MKQILGSGVVFFVTLIIAGFLFVLGLSQNAELNFQAIQVNEIIMKKNNNSQFSSQKNFNDLELDCHMQWFNLKPMLISDGIEPNLSAVEDMMQCSLLHTNFIRLYAPDDLRLAKIASGIYPDNPGILYWLADGLKEKSPEQAERLFQKIVELEPTYGNAWHRLALYAQGRGNIDEAINYNINSCVNNDPGKNGCYGAARLLEQQGHYKEAIYYYRFSTWEYSRDQAVRLEQELNNK